MITMTKKIYWRHILTTLLILGLMTGCSDWLDVTPQSEMDQEDLFARASGFEDALIGVYLNASDQNLYGKKLSYYDIELLAQQFKPNNEDLYQQALSAYDFNYTGVEALSESLFLNMYNAIANCNALIEHLESTTLSFVHNRKETIFGEALALRAWMHFDLMRLFHPNYSIDSDFKGIPYMTQLSYEPPVYNSSIEVREFVLEDLNKALGLLNQSDPIGNIEEDPDLFGSNRKLRMNIYAVKALLARVYLYIGDYESAYQYSHEVIESGLFSFIEEEDIIPNNDYLFQQELIFQLHHSQLSVEVESYFSASASNKLYCRNLSERYANDAVRRIWFNNIEAEDALFVRYNQLSNEEETSEGTTAKYSGLPILKLSEMVLIAAEGAAQVNLNEGITILNEIRSARGLPVLETEGISWTIEMVMEYIRDEYEREFFGEGQLFYFYKRINAKEIELPNGGNEEMNEQKYILPFPNSEIQFGGAQN